MSKYSLNLVRCEEQQHDKIEICVFEVGRIHKTKLARKSEYLQKQKAIEINTINRLVPFDDVPCKLHGTSSPQAGFAGIQFCYLFVANA